MELLLKLNERSLRTWSENAPTSIPVFVHPLYEYLRRKRDSSGPKVMLATTADAVESYNRILGRMRMVAFDRYPEELTEAAASATHAIVFEEFDRILLLRTLLPELPWQNVLLVPTNLGNSTPCEIQVPAGENPWYPQVADAFEHIGAQKEFVVYGGGFMRLPEPACAGTVLLFLLGLKSLGRIRDASAGTRAVLRA